jgi:hypothetical protein
MFFELICYSPTYVNWAIAEMNNKSFLMQRPSSRKDRLVKWNKYSCHKIGAVHVGTIWESVDNVEAARVPYDCRRHIFARDIKSRFCDYIISRQSPYAMW